MPLRGPTPQPTSQALTSERTLRARTLVDGATPDAQRGEVAIRPWGEFSFYARDPWDNPFCVVVSGSEYRGGDFGLPGR